MSAATSETSKTASSQKPPAANVPSTTGSHRLPRRDPADRAGKGGGDRTGSTGNVDPEPRRARQHSDTQPIPTVPPPPGAHERCEPRDELSKEGAARPRPRPRTAPRPVRPS